MKAPQLFCGAFALVMTVSACQKQTSQAELKQTASETAGRIKTESVKAAEKVEDVWLATKIQAKFVGDRDIKARDVKVSANDGVVTLKGRVGNESEHQLALTLAKNTGGVQQVVDNLDVEVAGPPPVRIVNGGTPGAAATTGTSASPSSPPPAAAVSDDGRITTSIQSKYFMDDRIKGRHIIVTTSGGVVTLTGEIADDTERAEALLLARTTESVKRVEDNLTISVAPAPASTTDADAALADRIKSQLASDNQVKNAPIEVTAKSGVVTLQGTVPMRAVKERALTVARGIDGVTQVVERIQVSPTKSAPTKRSPARKAKR